ncbi:unnamed protein product [Gordionus sp. m RMFG-2023]
MIFNLRKHVITKKRKNISKINSDKDIITFRPHKNKKKYPPISAKYSRKFNIYKIPSNLKYETFALLHQLWKEYASKLLDIDRYDQIATPNKINNEYLQIKILKMDLHGAILKVIVSEKCKTLKGLIGIMIKETKNTFKIICKDHRVKTIPKYANHFAMQVRNHLITFDGNNLITRPYQRITRKFKAKF